MQFTFQQTPEDIKDLQDHTLNRSNFYRYLGLVVVVIAGVILWSFLGNGPEMTKVLSWIIPLVLMGVIFVPIYRFMIKRIMDRPENKKRLYGHREMTFTEEGFNAVTPDADTDYQWSAVSKVEESAKSYFLYTGEREVILLPKRVAQTPAEKVELELLLRSRFPTAG